MRTTRVFLYLATVVLLIVWAVGCAYGQMDTSRVIMLVSDTTSIRPINNNDYNPCPPHPIMYYRQPPVHWYFGYFVSEYKNTILLGRAFTPAGYYLDEKKEATA